MSTSGRGTNAASASAATSVVSKLAGSVDTSAGSNTSGTAVVRVRVRLILRGGN